MDLVVGGSDDLLVPCGTINTPEDPGGGADVVLSGAVPDDGWVRCFRGQPGGVFTDAHEALCPAIEDGLWLGAAVADLDLDGLPELLLGEDFGTNRVWTRAAAGGMIDITGETGFSTPNHAMGIAAGDVDGDGLPDVYVADLGPDQLHYGTGCRALDLAGLDSGVPLATDRTIAWGIALLDVDHDGDLDVYVGNSTVALPGGFHNPSPTSCKDYPKTGAQHDLLLLGDGAGAFSPVPVAKAEGYAASWHATSAVAGDLDGDGDLDVVTVEEGAALVRWNQAAKAGGAVLVRPRTPKGLPVRGARVELEDPAGGVWRRQLWGEHGYSGHAPLEAHFGVGSSPGPFVVRVIWPEGSESVTSAATGDRIEVIQP
jgi:hypothetical protein